MLNSFMSLLKLVFKITTLKGFKSEHPREKIYIFRILAISTAILLSKFRIFY